MAKQFIRTNKAIWDEKDKSQYKDSIVFIEDTKEIWSNNVCYGKNPILFNTNELNINTINEHYFTPAFLENLKITKIPIIGNTKVEFNANNIKLQLPKEIVVNDLVDFRGYAKYILNLDHNYCKIDKYDYGDLSNYLIATYNNGATKLSNNNFLEFESLSRNGLQTMTEGPVFTNEVLITELDNIEDNAFRDCPSLTSITIPNGVKSIGYNAFQGCSGLTSVTIPNTVTSIGRYAFRDCPSLTSITIPNSITTISYSAFSYCSSLTSITIPNSVITIGEVAFRNCSSLTSITIPNSVTSIGSAAFDGCSSLTSITMESTTPPTISSSFNNTNTNLKIYVPSESVDAYKNATNWSDYADQISSISN